MNDYTIFAPDDSYYGAYRTRTFADIYPSFEDFNEEYTASALAISFTPEGSDGLTLSQLYYMLYAHYGNSHIAYSDENQFKYYLYSIIYQHGPRVIRKRELQLEMTKIGVEEAMQGGKAIYNHAYNPGTEPSTSTLEELLTINDQNTTNYKKSVVEAVGMLNALIEEDVVDDFIHKFKRLFIKILAPDYPLLYETEV